MLQAIKSVLVGLTEQGKAEPSSAFRYGLSLARAADAHLTIQAASVKFVVPYTLVGDFAAGVVATENARIEEIARAVAERARSSAEREGVLHSVESPRLSYANLAHSFLSHARVHDLSVLDLEEKPLDMDRGLIEAALFESGRPLLVVPPGHDDFTCRRVLVAWDGSRSAARAVADALPFLSMAESVEILSVNGEKDLSATVPGSELAPHLARHGAKVNVSLAHGGDVAQTIREQALSRGADMIVMGSYKHSRLREWLLGGVTQSLLKSSPLPLLTSH